MMAVARTSRPCAIGLLAVRVLAFSAVEVSVVGVSWQARCALTCSAV
eukprot:COSAG01_NODE_60383_length_295_cov_0.750000_1_plen_46_part_10